MSSNRFFLRLTFALFAFAFGSVPVLGTPVERDQSYEDSIINFYSPNNLENCEYNPFWTLPLQKEVNVVYYTKQHPEGKIFDLEIQPAPYMFESTETKLLTHGFRGDINSSEFKSIIAAYLERSENVNLLALNWSSYSNDKYRDAAKSAITVGKAVSSLFCILYKFYDIYPYQMHFIGHNLGAHLLAVTARESKTKVGRITGLDPARLCFEDHCNNLYYPQLSKNDAKFVDILHTDAGNYGIFNPQGTVDFYVNSGINQPMCHAPYSIIPVLDTCESNSAYLYFAESITTPQSFYGVRCDTIYPTLNCNKSNGVFWGEFMETIPRGIYNFNTRGKTPYGEGSPNVAIFKFHH